MTLYNTCSFGPHKCRSTFATSTTPYSEFLHDNLLPLLFPCLIERATWLTRGEHSDVILETTRVITHPSKGPDSYFPIQTHLASDIDTHHPWSIAGSQRKHTHIAQTNWQRDTWTGCTCIGVMPKPGTHSVPPNLIRRCGVKFKLGVLVLQNSISIFFFKIRKISSKKISSKPTDVCGSIPQNLSEPGTYVSQVPWELDPPLLLPFSVSVCRVI